MKKYRRLRQNRIGLTVLELILICGWIFLMQLIISPGAFRHSVGFLLRSPLLIVLNALPIAVLLLILYFIFGSTLTAGAVTNLVFGLMSYTNLLKIDGRDDPFVPGDIVLLREALQATGEYRLDMHLGIAALILVSTALLIILNVFIKSKKPAKKYRISGILLSLAVFFGSFFTLYSSSRIYESFPVTSPYNVTAIFNELGFNYCFLYNFNLYGVDKPDGYSVSEVKEWISAQDSGAKLEKKPQVLMIMCEAFSDLTDSDAFDYDDESDPLRCYKLVRDGDNCISGRIVVPNFGAGTANTEFDVLTGMQTNLISQTSNSALRSFHKDISSLARVFTGEGYGSFYFHPGDSWFYNRDSALSHMGIDDKIFIEDLEDKSVMDDVYLDHLKSFLTERTANGEKLFTYSTTIQNHQAYNYDKYAGTELPEVPVKAQISDEVREYLTVYNYGLKCSSEMLLELTDYLNTLNEPYILVFFGDHLPNLGADYLSYRELGMSIGGADTPEEIISTCSTPFIIWGNNAYDEAYDFDRTVASLDLPSDGRISACFLGELALEMAGGRDTDPYFGFLGDLRREMPVIKTGIVGTSDGDLSDSPTAAQQALVEKLRCWQYYRLKTESVGR